MILWVDISMHQIKLQRLCGQTSNISSQREDHKLFCLHQVTARCGAFIFLLYAKYSTGSPSPRFLICLCIILFCLITSSNIKNTRQYFALVRITWISLHNAHESFLHSLLLILSIFSLLLMLLFDLSAWYFLWNNFAISSWKKAQESLHFVWFFIFKAKRILRITTKQKIWCIPLKVCIGMETILLPQK